jgi:hypothetical protein
MSTIRGGACKVRVSEVTYTPKTKIDDPSFEKDIKSLSERDFDKLLLLVNNKQRRIFKKVRGTK